jgi:integral membrane protein
MLRALHLTSRLEASSYLVLLVAVVVKYATDNETGVAVMGPIHGTLYLVYVFAMLRWYDDLGWPFSKALMAMVLGALPFGGFRVDRSWLPR